MICDPFFEILVAITRSHIYITRQIRVYIEL